MRLNLFESPTDKQNIILVMSRLDKKERNIYCLNARKLYGKLYCYESVLFDTEKRKIQLQLKENRDNIKCPYCGNMRNRIHKQSSKHVMDLIELEGDCKVDSFKEHEMELWECFWPGTPYIIDLFYKKPTYQCLECYGLFQIDDSFVLSPKSHITKRMASYIKHYSLFEDYWWGKESYQYKYQKLIDGGFNLSYSTFYNICRDSSIDALISFSTDLKKDIEKQMQRLPYYLRPVDVVF